MQSQLEQDPQYRELFQPIGRLATPLSIAQLANRTLKAMRDATKSDVALSTSSSFRQSLPSGALTMELLRGAMPYDNEIVVCAMPGTQLQRLLDYDKSQSGTDAESYISGAESVDPSRSYQVATTDYLAFIAYKDVFTCDRVRTGLRVRDEVRKTLGQ
jgi:2',3'-cyclic-nucleotide 2'-phosphodiesterase (5'-nucleotidase family)